MPFIVEARRENLPDVVSGERDAVIVSRLAVGTLEEARAHAKGLVTLNRSAFYSAAFDLAMAQIDALSESGGTITLPDGQVVEVEPVTRQFLWLAIAGFAHGYRPEELAQQDDKLCSAFNARFAAPSPEHMAACLGLGDEWHRGAITHADLLARFAAGSPSKDV